MKKKVIKAANITSNYRGNLEDWMISLERRVHKCESDIDIAKQGINNIVLRLNEQIVKRPDEAKKISETVVQLTAVLDSMLGSKM